MILTVSMHVCCVIFNEVSVSVFSPVITTYYKCSVQQLVLIDQLID